MSHMARCFFDARVGSFSVLVTAALISCGTRGPEGPQGPQGPEGPTGPGFMGSPSIGSVVPAAVTQGSEYDVTISGFATEWSDSATVSFGQGITTSMVRAASPTSIIVHVKVAGDAPPDVREVTVTQAGATVRWRNAFHVLPRVKFTQLGTSSQLSLSVVRLEVNEPSFEFDTTQTVGQFDGVSVTTMPALPTRVLNLSAHVLDVLVLTPLDAGIQAHDLVVVSREGSFNERTFRAQQVVSVTPRVSSELVDGMPANGAIDKPYQSAAYRYAPVVPDGGSPTPIVLSVSSSNTTVAPKLSLIPTTGQWSDARPPAVARVINPAPGDVYWLVVFDGSGGSGFTYSVTATPTVRVTEEEPNDTPATARQATLPAIAGPMSFTSLTDQDWVKLTAGPGDVGMRFHVVTQPGDAFTDNVVEVFKDDGATSLGGESDDKRIYEDHFSTPIPAAGTYYVRVKPSSDVAGYDPTNSRYELLVTVEP